MLQIILLLLPGVLSDNWGVNYPGPICAARGSNVTIPCTFTYPSPQVKEVKWCSMNSNSGVCYGGPYVYDSESTNNQNNFQYIGDKSSDCSLLISNIKVTESGEYRFRFITSITNGQWTGNPGVNIKAHDLKVSMSSSRGNGSTIVGDSVNLTCSLGCPAGLADVKWFKNGHLINHSKPVLIFTRVTAEDSGNYSCSLKNFKNTSSEKLRIYVEGVFSKDWRVNYPDTICAARGSNVTINCTFTYLSVQVQQITWCLNNSNNEFCHSDPHVYNSEAINNQNNIQYIRDTSSDCSLLISNIKLTHSGEYRYRFTTSSPDDQWTGDPGVNITVHNLRVSMSSSRGNGRIILGDSVNLTCSLDCPADLADVQWFKNGDLMNQSKPILSFDRVNAQDSGNYSCSLRNFKTALSEVLRIHIEGVFSKDWRVNYPDTICAGRGSNVTINCTFTYLSVRVQQVKWCLNNSKNEFCHSDPHVYDSKAINNQNNFRDTSSDCSLLISNIKLTYSGEYRFRFTTSSPDDQWTGDPGVNITVHDVRVSMSSSRGNGSTIVGDSVNLTCSLDCPAPAGLADVQWFKNGHLMKESKPVLTFTRITAEDSGNYSCSLRNFKNTSSEKLMIHIEVGPQNVHRILIIVASSVGLVFIIAFVMLVMFRRGKTQPQRQPMEGKENKGFNENVYQTTEAVNEPQEVQYISVNFKAKETVLMPVEMEQQEDSVIYSSVLNS